MRKVDDEEEEAAPCLSKTKDVGVAHNRAEAIILSSAESAQISPCLLGEREMIMSVDIVLGNFLIECSFFSRFLAGKSERAFREAFGE